MAKFDITGDVGEHHYVANRSFVEFNIGANGQIRRVDATGKTIHSGNPLDALGVYLMKG